MSRTCCAGSGGCARTTGRTPPSASPARRSATPPTSRPGCVGFPSRPSMPTAHPRPSGHSRCGNDRSSIRTSGRGRRPTSRPRCCSHDSSTTDNQTLAFTRSRKGAELVATQARGLLAESRAGHGSKPPAVAAYRAGYLATERRELEAQLTSGELGGVVATSALELGIDVGSLDAVVLNGFPGTLSSMRQQVGRAGRTTRRAAAVLIVGDDQLDQWYARHPKELLTRPAEAAVVNPDNPFVARAQISCAAHEMPLTHADDQFFGDALDDAVRDLVLDDLLKTTRRPDVLGRPRAARRPGRPAHGFVARIPAGRHRRPVGRHRRRGAHLPRRASRRDLPPPGAPVPASAPSTPTTTSRSSSRPTTPTSTPKPARRPI